LKLLLDQGVPRSAATELVRSGVDAVHVSDLGMASATDREILARALEDDRTLVSLDADFHTLLALSNAARPSVLRIRIEGLRGIALAALLREVLALSASDLAAGAMMSVDGSNVRIRALPLVR
jgi:predicted nuclease of predicted toxin-antitoxin system